MVVCLNLYKTLEWNVLWWYDREPRAAESVVYVAYTNFGQITLQIHQVNIIKTNASFYLLVDPEKQDLVVTLCLSKFAQTRPNWTQYWADEDYLPSIVNSFDEISVGYDLRRRNFIPSHNQHRMFPTKRGRRYIYIFIWIYLTLSGTLWDHAGDYLLYLQRKLIWWKPLILSVYITINLFSLSSGSVVYTVQPVWIPSFPPPDRFTLSEIATSASPASRKCFIHSCFVSTVWF